MMGFYPLGSFPLGGFGWDEETAATPPAPFIGGNSRPRRVRRIPGEDDDEEALILAWWTMQ